MKTRRRAIILVDPVCGVNEKGTRDKNDRNEVLEKGTNLPLDLYPNDIVEVDEEFLPYAEKLGITPSRPFIEQTRQRNRERSARKNNPYGNDFVVYRIDLKKIAGDEILASQ